MNLGSNGDAYRTGCCRDDPELADQVVVGEARAPTALRGKTFGGQAPAVIGRQPPAAMEVLLAQTVHADAAVAREDSEFSVLDRQIAVGGQVLQLQGLGGVYPDIFLPLHGEHQAHNAAIALAAVEAFFGAGVQRQLGVDAIRAGFAAVTSPGRLERVRSAPTVLLDAAHNPAGAAALADTLASPNQPYEMMIDLDSSVTMKAAGVRGVDPAADPLTRTHKAYLTLDNPPPASRQGVIAV